jgi:O-antigen biosynthesis protein
MDNCTVNEAHITQARAAFESADIETGLALLRQVSSNAQSPEDIRQAFAILQIHLGAAGLRGAQGRQASVTGKPLLPLSERPRISVILPTKNRPEMLAHALQSLAAQTWEDWECIVINDGGAPVKAVIEASPARARVVQVVNEESVGQAAARNLGIDRAEGEILCFLDDDDRYAPRHLAVVAGALRGAGPAMCYTRIETVLERVDDSGRHDLARRAAYAPPAFSYPLLQVRSYMPTVSWGIRTDCLRQTGGFDEVISFMEDWELLLRLARQWDFAQLDEVTAEYRLRESHVSDSVSKSGHDSKGTMEKIYARNPSSDAVVIFARKLYQWLVLTGNFAVAAAPRPAA